MPDQNDKLKQKVMSRIYRSWLIRSVIPLFLIEFAAILIAVYFFANLIFVGAVIDNALNAALRDPFKFVSYLWNAFLSTRIEVQGLVILLIIAAIFILKDINRGIISYLMVRKGRMMEK